MCLTKEIKKFQDTLVLKKDVIQYLSCTGVCKNCFVGKTNNRAKEIKKVTVFYT
jgi:hypothetical protein